MIWPGVLLAPREKVGVVSKNHAGKLEGALLPVMGNVRVCAIKPPPCVGEHSLLNFEIVFGIVAVY